MLAVTDEGASCAARAVSSDSVSCMLIAWRRLAHRFPDIVPGAAGESPQRRGLGKGEQRSRGESCDEVCNFGGESRNFGDNSHHFGDIDKITILSYLTLLWWGALW